jgi:antitoxin (DNA-binding transcriptional repressor) of toxin-antitoxin stability system
MKTFSLAALQKNTVQVVRSTQSTGQQIALMDRGEIIAYITPVIKIDRLAPSKVTWADRILRPGYAKALKEGRLKSTGDSTIGISEDRTSRDDSVAGLETFDPLAKRAKKER